jgi:hypothetical protein
VTRNGDGDGDRDRAADAPGRVRSAVRRPLWLMGSLAAVVGLAFLVARPRTDTTPVAVNYTGVKSAKPPGLQIYLHRADEVRILAPGTPVRAGDALRFVARIAEPRYLAVRARDAAGNEQILFPAAGADAGAGGGGVDAQRVQPGQALPGALVLDAVPGRQIVVAMFSDRPFRAADPPGDGVEVVTIELVKEP